MRTNAFLDRQISLYARWKNTEAAWLAGIFDGEGTVSWKCRASRCGVEGAGGRRPVGAWNARLRIQMDHEGTIARIGQLFDLEPRPSTRASGKVRYSVDVSSSGTEAFLLRARPYFVTKAAQADLVCEVLQLRRAIPVTSRGAGGGKGGHRLPDAAQGLFMAYDEAIGSLNSKKGWSPEAKERHSTARGALPAGTLDVPGPEELERLLRALGVREKDVRALRAVKGPADTPLVINPRRVAPFNEGATA